MRKKMINFVSKLLLLTSFLVAISLDSAEGPTTEQMQALESLRQGQDISTETNQNKEFREIQTSTNKADNEDYEECLDCIYGYELFRSTPTTFSLLSDVPIPPDYLLGPGDKVRIEYYGNENSNKNGYITRGGTFHLPLLGPVTIAGLTLSDAIDLITKKVESELIGTEVFVTISELRSINVYLVGAAYKPGSYTVSALSTLTNALFAAGGPNEFGSLRNIELKRGGELIQEFDLYELILKGNIDNDLRLQQGDVIFIPLQKRTVEINGSVKRPGKFEIVENEKITDLLGYAGYSDRNGRIELSRVDYKDSRRNFTLFNVNELDKLEQELVDGDFLNVLNSSELLSNNVYISGEVLYPGYYGINAGDTILDLIEKSGGLKNTAYTPGAIFTREDVAILQKESYVKTAESLEKSLVDAISTGAQIEGEAYVAIQQFIQQLKNQEPIGRQVIEADSFLLRSDPRLNISLQNGDTLHFPRRSSALTVVGEVLNSATHIYKQGYTVQDYIKLSGGLTSGADPKKIFIILPNGQSVQSNPRLFGRGGSASLLPGSTVVVSRNPDPFDWLKLTGIITPVLSDLAVSAAAISAISNDN